MFSAVAQWQIGLLEIDDAANLCDVLLEAAGRKEAEQELEEALSDLRKGNDLEPYFGWLALVIAFSVAAHRGHELDAEMLWGSGVEFDEADGPPDEWLLAVGKRIGPKRSARWSGLCLELLPQLTNGQSAFLDFASGDYRGEARAWVEAAIGLLDTPSAPTPRSDRTAAKPGKRKIGKDGFYRYPASEAPAGSGEVFAFEHEREGVFWGRVVRARAKDSKFDTEFQAIVEVYANVTETDDVVPKLDRSQLLDGLVFVHHELWTNGLVTPKGRVPLPGDDEASRLCIRDFMGSLLDQFGEDLDPSPGPEEQVYEVSCTDPWSLRPLILEAHRTSRGS